MGLKSLIGLGGEESSDEELEPPSHVCQSCGEKYFTDPDVEIRECRACGGVRVDRA